MKLYLISQNLLTKYDTYNSAVVSAESPDDAKDIHPDNSVTHVKNDKWFGTYAKGGEYQTEPDTWVRYSEIGHIKVEYLGETEKKRGVILASYRAG